MASPAKPRAERHLAGTMGEYPTEEWQIRALWGRPAGMRDRQRRWRAYGFRENEPIDDRFMAACDGVMGPR